MYSITYLAAPYTKGSAATRLARFAAVTHVAAQLIQTKLFVYSPITMTHPIDVIMAAEGETLGSDFWVDFDEAFMRVCSTIRVLMLDGWKQSSGVSREIAHFASRGESPQYLDPGEFGIVRQNPRFAAAFSPK
jgi:hypothetical protein